MSEYTPDSWVIIKISGIEDKDFYKVLCGWSGGYLDGDSWRMNSGIDKVKFDGEYYSFIGQSGSVYKCHQAGESMRLSMSDTWLKLKKEFPDNVELVGVDDIVTP